MVGLVLLFLYPTYSLPDWTMGWMAVMVLLLSVVTLASWFTSRKLKREGYNTGRLRWLGVFQWMSVLVWLAGSCMLVWTFVEVVGLV